MKQVLLIEDDPYTQDWLSEMLKRAFSGVTISAVDSLEGAEAALVERNFSLSLIDIHLPDGRGIDIIQKIKEQNPGTFCVVVTAFDDTAYIFDALKAGADGYLLKSHNEDKLVQSLKEISEGVPPLSPPIARRIIKFFCSVDGASDSRLPTGLTSREEEVLIFIAKGMTRNETARLLGIRPGTVAGYIKRIYEKLDVASRAEAALEAKRMGLI